MAKKVKRKFINNYKFRQIYGNKALVFKLLKSSFAIMSLNNIPLYLINRLINAKTLEKIVKFSNLPLSMCIEARGEVIINELRNLIKNNKEEKINCLEIGTWCGKGTTSLIAKEISGRGHLTCLDTYSPWSSEEDLKKNNAYRLYDKSTNIALVLASNTIRKYGEKYLIKTNLVVGNIENFIVNNKKKFYNFIFLDGDHKYKSFKKDLEIAKELIAPKGILIGDDFEVNLPFKDGLYDECKKHLNEDMIFSKIEQEYVHPGLVCALSELLNVNANIKLDSQNGCWIIRNA